MNRALLNVAKVNRALYRMLFKDLVKAEVFTTANNEFQLIADGDIRNIKIFFRGNAKINSRLPEGYSLFIGHGFIRIRNIMGKTLPSDNVLFTYESGFFISSVEVRSWFRKTRKIKVNRYETSKFMSLSETKFEDNTLIFSETTSTEIKGFSQRSGSNNNIITGLYTNQPFSNGYTGYYHYFQKENIYMTGKYPSKTAELLGGTKIVDENFKIINKLQRAQNSNIRREAQNRHRFDKVMQTIDNEVSDKKKIELGSNTLNLQRPIDRSGLSQRISKASKIMTKSATSTIKKGGY